MARKRLLTPMGSTRGHALARANMMSAAHPALPPLYPAPLTTRRSYDDTALFTPYRPSISHHTYDTTGTDNYTRSEVNRELFMSSAAMQDNFDIAHKSRNRDKDVLLAANRAIVDTELHASPKSAVAARRAVRGHSTPPAFSHPYVEKKEAALLANKVEITRPERKRRPRSLYVQNRLREMGRDHSTETAAAVPAAYTAGLTASKPVYKPALVKPIQDVAGVRKPNIMSWQHKLDARVNPDDMIIVPRSLNNVRARLRDAQEKMDRHKQMIDRYLNTDTGLTVDDMRVSVNNGVDRRLVASLNEPKASDRIRKKRERLMRKHAQ